MEIEEKVAKIMRICFKNVLSKEKNDIKRG